MKFTLVATILLGLVLTPALGSVQGVVEVKTGQQVPGQGDTEFPEVAKKSTIVVGRQILTINWQYRVASIENTTPRMSWKTLWNYNIGAIATRVLSDRVCYLSLMDRNVMPTFDDLPRLAERNRFLQDQIRPSKQVTYVIKKPIQNIQSFGQEVFNMCKGLTTYLTHEVHKPKYTLNQACTRLNVLHILDLVYCPHKVKG